MCAPKRVKQVKKSPHSPVSVFCNSAKHSVWWGENLARSAELKAFKKFVGYGSHCHHCNCATVQYSKISTPVYTHKNRRVRDLVFIADSLGAPKFRNASSISSSVRTKVGIEKFSLITFFLLKFGLQSLSLTLD